MRAAAPINEAWFEPPVPAVAEIMAFIDTSMVMFVPFVASITYPEPPLVVLAVMFSAVSDALFAIALTISLARLAPVIAVEVRSCILCVAEALVANDWALKE
jgi:hypothetical protein